MSKFTIVQFGIFKCLPNDVLFTLAQIEGEQRRPIFETVENIARKRRSSVNMTDPAHYATSSKCARTVTFFGGVKRNKRNHKKFF